MKRALLDTNVILRALLNDEPSLSKEAQDFIRKASKKGWQLHTTDLVISEVLYVLASKKLYSFSREEVADYLSSFVSLTNLQFPSRDIFFDVLSAYESTNIDFADLHLFFTAKLHGFDRVVSFDMDLERLKKEF